MASYSKCRVMFEDEARFGCINEPRRCWAPSGVRPTVPSQMIREYTYGFAAVSPLDGVMDSFIFPRADTVCMSIFLREIAERHCDEYIIIFLDKAGWHCSRDLHVPVNMLLAHLPPHSPNLNPAEHVWEEVREKWFRNGLFSNLDQVDDTLLTAFRTLENDTKTIASITGFHWIISSISNAN
jgi:transposase